MLVGDYILSTALLNVSYSHSEEIVRNLAELGRIFYLPLSHEPREQDCRDLSEWQLRLTTEWCIESLMQHLMRCVPNGMNCSRSEGM